MEEVGVEEEPPRAGSATSRPGRGSLPEGRNTKAANKMRGEMDPEELREIWAEPRRVVAQRVLESSVAAAAAAELTHQLSRRAGMAELVCKQEERPTEGGAAEMDRNLKAITASATTTAAVRRRSGRDEPTSEAYSYGKQVASLVGGADERFAAAVGPAPSRPTAPHADSRFAAGVRADEPMRQLKRELRSRIRAKGHREEVKREDARRRLDAEAAMGGGRLAVGATWNVDDGLGELSYKTGSWVCKLCNTVCPPEAGECIGWIAGARCEGTFSHSFKRYATSRPSKGAKRGRETALERALRSSSWRCDQC